MTLLTVLALAAFATDGPGAYPGGLEAELRLEAALEAKMDRVLDEAFGPRRARVAVDATLEQSVIEETVDRPREGEAELPGYRRPAAAKRLSSEPDALQRLSVRLIVDPGLTAAEKEKAEELVRGVLALDAERGDDIVFVTAPLQDTPRKLLNRPWVRVAAAAAGAAFALAAVLIFLAARAARRSAVLAVRQIRAEQALRLSDPGAQAPGPGGPVIDAVLALPAPEGTLGLGFITARNLRLTARFLENRSPAAARWVLASIDPDLAASLFRLLPVPVRQNAAVELAKSTSAQPPGEPELRRLTDDLRDFIARESRGPGLLQELLVRSPESLRKAVLDGIRLNVPAALPSVQGGLSRFEDLERADAGSLALLARETTSEELAVALRGASPALRNRLLASLPAVLREGAERRSRRGDEDSDQTLSARAAILARWRELEASGKVRPL
ncbi:MAG: hypothetical protein HY553_21430 [Elusimicrobia bacterium]|nr:hypothetical protein [Elusimicrobiota bacterium]